MFPAEVDVAIGGGTLPVSLYGLVANIIQNSLGGGIKLGSITICDPVNSFRCCTLTGIPALITFKSFPVSGDFELYFGSNTAGPFAYDVTASTIQTAVNSLNGLASVVVTGNTSSGFYFDWKDGAVVPISIFSNTLGVDINIFNTVEIYPGTGGGFGDINNSSAGGLLAFEVYSNAV